MVAEDVYSGTRRQLRGVAESFVAGPQYRAAGTIRLTARADGFAAVAFDASVAATDLIWGSSRAALAGTVAALTERTGLDVGPPEGVYEIVDALSGSDVLDVDPGAADVLYRCLHAGALALARVLPGQEPVLWPEHFDVAVTEAEVNYGVSAGDDFHQLPYAYVGPWTKREGPFWNAPFGAIRALDPSRGADVLADDVAAFFQAGRAEASRPA